MLLDANDFHRISRAAGRGLTSCGIVQGGETKDADEHDSPAAVRRGGQWFPDGCGDLGGGEPVLPGEGRNVLEHARPGVDLRHSALSVVQLRDQPGDGGYRG